MFQGIKFNNYKLFYIKDKNLATYKAEVHFC